MTLGLSNLNSANFFTQANGLVSGSELEKVSSEIFSKAQITSTTSVNEIAPRLNLTKTATIDNGTKLFGVDSTASAELTKQVATNKAGYDITLSQKALSAIDALNTQAAKLQTTIIPKAMEGKVFVPVEKAEISDLKSTFAPQPRFALFASSDTNKDKKGSNPFFTGIVNDNNKEENEGLNLII